MTVKGGMIDNSTSTLASNTISLTNVFKLLEDQNYTINVFLSVFEEENVIEYIKNFSRFNL